MKKWGVLDNQNFLKLKLLDKILKVSIFGLRSLEVKRMAE